MKRNNYNGQLHNTRKKEIASLGRSCSGEKLSPNKFRENDEYAAATGIGPSR